MSKIFIVGNPIIKKMKIEKDEQTNLLGQKIDNKQQVNRQVNRQPTKPIYYNAIDTLEVFNYWKPKDSIWLTLKAFYAAYKQDFYRVTYQELYKIHLDRHPISMNSVKANVKRLIDNKLVRLRQAV